MKDLVTIFEREQYNLEDGLFVDYSDNMREPTPTAKDYRRRRNRIIPDDELFDETYEGIEEEE